MPNVGLGDRNRTSRSRPMTGDRNSRVAHTSRFPRCVRPGCVTTASRPDLYIYVTGHAREKKGLGLETAAGGADVALDICKGPPGVTLSPPADGRRVAAVALRNAGILRGVYPERSERALTARSAQNDNLFRVAQTSWLMSASAPNPSADGFKVNSRGQRPRKNAAHLDSRNPGGVQAKLRRKMFGPFRAGNCAGNGNLFRGFHPPQADYSSCSPSGSGSRVARTSLVDVCEGPPCCHPESRSDRDEGSAVLLCVGRNCRFFAKFTLSEMKRILLRQPTDRDG